MRGKVKDRIFQTIGSITALGEYKVINSFYIGLHRLSFPILPQSQVDKAFDHALGNKDSIWEHVRLTVQCRTRNTKGRGVYLRDGVLDASCPVVESTITVTPCMHESTSAQEKIDFG